MISVKTKAGYFSCRDWTIEISRDVRRRSDLPAGHACPGNFAEQLADFDGCGCCCSGFYEMLQGMAGGEGGFRIRQTLRHADCCAAKVRLYWTSLARRRPYSASVIDPDCFS
jgi:hypothetical protein